MFDASPYEYVTYIGKIAKASRAAGRSGPELLAFLDWSNTRKWGAEGIVPALKEAARERITAAIGPAEANAAVAYMETSGKPYRDYLAGLLTASDSKLGMMFPDAVPNARESNSCTD